MDAKDMKKCPYCAEWIKAEAVKCRYCGSNISGKDVWRNSSGPQFWRREEEGKKIAGVCTGIARQLDAPILILPLRLFFVLTTLFYGFGLILYAVLWILMPPSADKPDQGKGTFQRTRPDQPSAGPCPPVEPCPPAAEPESSPKPETPPSTPSEESVPPPAEDPGRPPREESDSSHQMTGIKLFLGLAAVIFAIIFVFGGWRLFPNPFFGMPVATGPIFHIPGLPFPGLPSAEWVKLLVIGGVMLIILAGADIIALGIIPLALVTVGGAFFLRGMHYVSHPLLIIATAAVIALLIAFQTVRRFSRPPRVIDNSL